MSEKCWGERWTGGDKNFGGWIGFSFQWGGQGGLH